MFNITFEEEIMTEQITDTIMMVKPIAFTLNEETAVNNLFQPREQIIPDEKAQNLALQEFDNMVENLRTEGIEILVYEDIDSSETPDSIFPNNWITTHEDGRILIFPMFAENRRKERRRDIIDDLSEKFKVEEIHSFTNWEREDKFLESTGSLILDRPNKLAYTALSDRTHPEVLADFSKFTGYKVISFTANQTFEGYRLPIYHTNVMMCLGEEFAAICLDSIDNKTERKIVTDHLNETGKEIIAISESQRDNFAGNMLQVMNNNKDRYIVLSESAFSCLTEKQRKCLQKHGKLLHNPINTIERLGGGSARCMMAEIFLKKRM